MIISTGEKYVIDPDNRYTFDFYTETDKVLKDVYASMKQTLLEEMEKNSIDSVETDKLIIVYVAETDDEKAHLDIKFKSDLLQTVNTSLETNRP